MHIGEARHATETAAREALRSAGSAAARVHKGAEAAAILHILREEHLEDLVRIEGHSSGHTSGATATHIKVHAATRETAHTSPVLHVVHAHATIVLLALLWI